MSVWLGNNNKGIAIVRVSSHRQEGNTSHATQQAEISGYCGLNGIQLVKSFQFIESAKNSDTRKKYNEAIDYALAKSIRHVLFYMSDRESRNQTDAEKNEKLIKAGLIVVHYVRDKRVVHAGTPDSDFFMREVETAANKNYSRVLGTRISDAQKKKAEQGIYPGNHPPLGYIHRRQEDEDGKPIRGTSRLVADPKTAPVVLREFELRAEGYSFREIRDRILGEGILPPKLMRRYHHSAIEYRLKNTVYGGPFEWQGEVYEGKHELIIPKHVYRKAVDTLGFRKFTNIPKNEEGGHFSGSWMRCAECGCVVTYERKVKTYRSGKTGTFHLYHCTNGRRAHESMRGRIVAEQILWAQFDHALDRLALTPEIADRIATSLRRSDGVSDDRIKREIASLNGIVKSTEEREDRAYDDLGAGILDREGYGRQREKLRTEREAARADLIKWEGYRSSQVLDTADSIIELATSAKSIYLSRSLGERRQFLETFLSNPRLRGVTLEYDYKTPFSSIVSFSEDENWCARLDEFRTACLIYRSEIPWKIEAPEGQLIPDKKSKS